MRRSNAAYRGPKTARDSVMFSGGGTRYLIGVSINRITIIIVGTVFSICAGDFLLFPEHKKAITAETMPYTQMLHAGVENDTFYMRGRFGVDFPLIGYRFDDNGGLKDYGVDRAVNFGINAAAHINMRPTDGGKFPVDNFYAALAIYFSGVYGQRLSWRFYPIHHVSAHLADGYRGGDILKEGVRAVSSEMIRGEIYYSPFGDNLELGAGAGWYYHVCAQKDLTYRADISVLATYNDLFAATDGASMRPFALLRFENAYQSKNNFGVDLSAGAIGMKKKRGLGLSFRYFNKLHSGYYFEEYEKGYGFELTFFM